MLQYIRINILYKGCSKIPTVGVLSSRIAVSCPYSIACANMKIFSIICDEEQLVLALPILSPKYIKKNPDTFLFFWSHSGPADHPISSDLHLRCSAVNTSSPKPAGHPSSRWDNFAQNKDLEVRYTSKTKDLEHHEETSDTFLNLNPMIPCGLDLTLSQTRFYFQTKSLESERDLALSYSLSRFILLTETEESVK